MCIKYLKDALMANVCVCVCVQAMEKEVDAGRIRSLGVSNFNTKQLTRIMKEARVPLSCNQVELHAHFQQTELRLDCSTLNVPLTAFSPLGSPGARNHFVKKYNYRY